MFSTIEDLKNPAILEFWEQLTYNNIYEFCINCNLSYEFIATEVETDTPKGKCYGYLVTRTLVNEEGFWTQRRYFHKKELYFEDALNVVYEDIKSHYNVKAIEECLIKKYGHY